MARTSVLRDRGDGRVARVTNTELFFDLVFVFAFTQLSEHLYEQLSWHGAIEVLVLFVALWWAWNYTAWATGWIDPERLSVVLLLALLMLASLVMAAALPQSFGSRGVEFAAPYVVLQVVRSAFMVWAFRPRDPRRRNYVQVLVWSLIAGVFWILGGALHISSDTRLLFWGAGALLDVIAPLHGFWLPGFGSTPTSAWTPAGTHLAERCQLLLMIAFGESFLRTGEAFAARPEDWRATIAFGVGFVLAFSLWSMYFLHHAEPASERIAQSTPEDAARLGLTAFSYAHAVMVGAIVIMADALHLAIEHPTGEVTGGFAGVCLGGPALYLVGLSLSKRWLGHGRVWRPLIGAAALAVFGIAGAFGERLTELIAAALVSAILASAVWYEARDSAPAPL